MRFLLIILAFVSITFEAIAQYSAGARQISLSNSDVAMSNDVFSLFNNPAGLSQMNWRELGIYYSPAPFGLSELSNGYLAYNEPFDFGSIGIGVMTYGFELYRENKISVGYSYNYLNKFFAGVVLNLHTVSIINYGDDNIFYLNAGGLYYLQNDLRLGFSVHNVNRASFGSEKDNVPFVFNLGLSYDVLDEFNFNISMEKDVRYNYSLRGGIEYNLFDYISLRTGFSNEPSRYSAGIGINYSYFSLDYAFFTHQDLGLTHQAGLLISFGSEGNRNDRIRKHLHNNQ
jgi:hypothetical protein